MVIHTKEKAKIHAHEPKGAKIKGSNIYTVERGPKVHDAKANEMDKKASAKLMLQKSAGGKRTYRKSTIHQSEAKDKGLSRFKRNIRESGTSIKTKNTNLHIAGRTGYLSRFLLASPSNFSMIRRVINSMSLLEEVKLINGQP